MSDNEKFPAKMPDHPVYHRRNRTISMNLTAEKSGVNLKGTIVDFCRTSGHGTIKDEKSDDTYFLHIFDMEGEFVPLPGDTVRFGKMLIPPKFEKYQAVNVQIINFVHEKHKKWSDPVDTGEIKNNADALIT